MIESCIAIIFLCLLFFGLFQMIHAYVARDVLDHAAARAARAKTVGFNQWMVGKTMRVAAIPNAGRLLSVSGNPPAPDTVLATYLATMNPGQLWDVALTNSPVSPTIGAELNAVPYYLGSRTSAEADFRLQYERWDSLGLNISVGPEVLIDPSAASLITARVSQTNELLIALATLNDGDLNGPPLPSEPGYVLLVGGYEIENHCSLYLNDQNW